jgi:hypothetical protein
MVSCELKVKCFNTVTWFTKAWFLDCDTYWMRGVVLGITWSKSTFGHVIGSMVAHQGAMCRGTVEDREKYWRVHYLRAPGEPLLVASPFRFGGLSPLATSLVSILENLLEDPPRGAKNYNSFMNLIVCSLSFMHSTFQALTLCTAHTQVVLVIYNSI